MNESPVINVNDYRVANYLLSNGVSMVGIADIPEAKKVASMLFRGDNCLLLQNEAFSQYLPPLNEKEYIHIHTMVCMYMCAQIQELEEEAYHG